jgi:hypothetical protein
MTTRRNFVALAGAAGFRRAAAVGPVARTVDGWPSRSGARDLADRDRRTGPEFPLLCRQSEDTFGQSFVLENMPGGSGSIGCMAVARSAADGHTILLALHSFIVLAPLVISWQPGERQSASFDPPDRARCSPFQFLLVGDPGSSA